MQNKNALLWSNRLILALIPLLISLTGIIYGLSYSSLSIFNSLLLILFIYLNLTYYRQANQGKNLLAFKLVALGLSLVIAFILAFNQSYLLAFNLILYVLFNHSKYIFRYYRARFLHVLILLFFNSFLLNIASFYITANFVPVTLGLLIVPILIPVLMYQEHAYFVNKRKLANLLVFASVAIGCFTMFFTVGFWSLLYLLVIPLTAYVSKKVKIDFIHCFIFWQLCIHLIIVLIF